VISGCTRMFEAPPNLSIGADPQQQEAASSQMLMVRPFLR
jgi:hypothetical protein